MCDFAVSFDTLRDRFGAEAEPVIDELRDYALADSDELVALLPSGVQVTERGRPFVRSIAARFDSYLNSGTARHSVAV